MLTLTDNAATLIKGYVKRFAKRSGAGLRISRAPNGRSTRMDVSVAYAPEENDQVVEWKGARVFVDPEVVPHVDSKQLDATVSATALDLSLRPLPDTGR